MIYYGLSHVKMKKIAGDFLVTREDSAKNKYENGTDFEAKPPFHDLGCGSGYVYFALLGYSAACRYYASYRAS